VKIQINKPSFFYQHLAGPITDSIISLMKNNIKSHSDTIDWIYNHKIDDEYNYVNWNFKLSRSKSLQRSYDIWATAGLDECAEPAIDINIVLPAHARQKSIVIDRPELFGTVAHELHHIAQNTQSDYAIKRVSSNKVLDYFLDPFEIEAFHIGFRAQSALSGAIISDIARHYLRNYKLSESNLTKIVTAWQNTDFPIFELASAAELGDSYAI